MTLLYRGIIDAVVVKTLLYDVADCTETVTISSRAKDKLIS